MSEPKTENSTTETQLSKQVKEVMHLVRAIKADTAALREQLDLLMGDVDEGGGAELPVLPVEPTPAEDDAAFARAVEKVEDQMMAQIEKRIRSLEEIVDKFTADPVAKVDPGALAQLDDHALANLIAEKMKTKLFERKQLARMAMLRKFNRTN